MQCGFAELVWAEGKMIWKSSSETFWWPEPWPQGRAGLSGKKPHIEPEANRYVHHDQKPSCSQSNLERWGPWRQKPIKRTVWLRLLDAAPDRKGLVEVKMEMQPGNRYRYGSRAAFLLHWLLLGKISLRGLCLVKIDEALSTSTPVCWVLSLLQTKSKLLILCGTRRAIYLCA